MKGLRARLLLVVLLPTIPALLLALNTNLEQRRYGRAKAGVDALRLVQGVAASQNALIETARGHFNALTKFPQAFGNDFSTFEKFFGTMCKIYPDYTDFGIVETNGALISSSFGLRGETNVAERLDFKGVLKTHDLYVGEYQPSNNLSKASLPLGYPLLDQKGRLVRVIYGALDLAVLNRALVKATLPEGGVAEVFDRNGHVLAQIPAAQESVGNSCLGSELFTSIVRQVEGIGEMKGLDGATRLYAFTALRVKDAPNLFVSVGIPTSLAYSESKQTLLFNLIMLCAVALLALLAAWRYADAYILQPIQALVSSTRRVGSGDLSARTGIAHASADLQELAQAFDEMAGGLEKKRVEMEQAQGEIRRLNATLEGRVAERTAQLAELNRQLEAFSYSVSHDLRAPLRHIAAYLVLLQHESGSSFTAEARNFLGNISGSITRMNDLVEGLLDFARTSREELRREHVAMNELVQEVQREMTRDTDGRDIRWEIESMPEVFVDRTMFKQVWTNLLANAVKYTRECKQAKIKVGCRNQPDQVEFYVNDNGAGFDMKYVDKLFGVFQRLHPADAFEGTGIGLANVHRIVSRHGGQTWAEGAINQGATFWFSLPKDASKPL